MMLPGDGVASIGAKRTATSARSTAYAFNATWANRKGLLVLRGLSQNGSSLDYARCLCNRAARPL